MALQQEAGNDYAAAIALENLGEVAMLEGRVPQALRHLEEATASYLRRRYRDPRGSGDDEQGLPGGRSRQRRPASRPNAR